MSAPAGYRIRRVLMEAERVARTLARIAHEIVERHPSLDGVVLVGVQTRGVPLARRLADLVGKAGGARPPVGALDITLYRDDLTTIAPNPVLKGTDIPCSIDGRTVVLADDVLYTGRTVRAALDELVDFGRPARIELAVLVDRGRRELPIQADYAGDRVVTSEDEIVQVLLREEDGEDRVVLLGRERGPARGRKPASSGPARRESRGSRRRRRP